MSENKSENCNCEKHEKDVQECECQTMTKQKACNCEPETDCDCLTKKEQLLREVEQENKKTIKIGGEELQEIYHNACLGKESVEILRPLSTDKRFRNLLIRQYKDYSALAKEMEIYASQHNIDLKGTTVVSRGMMYFTTMLNTIKDKSNSKLSEVMLQGINMGIISTTKLVNKLNDENKDCPYACRLLDLLNKNLEEMKLFL